MGGDAGVRSTPGHGSHFWFTVRLRKGEQHSVTDHLQSAAELLATLRQRHGGMCVLVAKDEPLNREIACILLEEAGFVMEEAEDGVVALEKASQAAYGLILLDMHMPRMDGMDATRKIRQPPGCAAIAIVAMTANAVAEDKTRCLASGMNAFITKPVPRDGLYRALLMALSY